MNASKNNSIRNDNKKLIIIGIGNLTRKDDGVGIQIINQLKEMKDIPTGVKVVDLGTGGVDIALALDGWEKAIIIDAIRGEINQVGTIIEQIVQTNKLPDIKGMSSTHGFDAITALKLAKEIESIKIPKEIRIIGVEIKEEGMGVELSPKVKSAVPKIIARIIEIINWLNED
jgi:hydrogenase maturation protease